jgi:16S rRNA (uracil1498-N3)-methyltransferase
MYFYVTHLPVEEGELRLDGDVFRHIKALRVKINEEFTLFNGKGQYIKMALKQIEKRHCIVRSVSGLQQAPVEQDIHIILGIPKLSTLEFVLTKLTELGVSRISLVKSEFTPIAFDQALYEKKIVRWEKLCISACEQSQRLYLPRINLVEFQELPGEEQVFICHPGADQKILDCNLKGPVTFAIGPEGGWSTQDVALLSGQNISLSDGVLRTDTACMAVLLAVKMQS